MALPSARSLLALLAVFLIRALRLTWRVRLSGPAPDYDAGPLVFCFRHGRQAGLLAHPRPRPVALLSSLSRDGELQARILSRLGFVVLRGSSSRAGAAGLKGLIGAIAGGADAAFAVDGPRGPLGEVKPGAVLAARSSGAALIPITTRASRGWVFSSAWDRYLLPGLFARVDLVRGASISASADGDTEVTRERLQDALDTLEARDQGPSSGPRSAGAHTAGS